MASLSAMLQKISDYWQEMFEDSRLNNLDVVSTSFNRTPLHTAVMSDDVKFAKNIPSLKPDLALTIDSEGLTPLHLASAGTNLQMVRLLLAARPGACIAQDEDGRTPLHLAAMNDRVEMIMKLLMEDGLSEAIHLKNDNETILHFCVKSNSSFETLEVLLEQLAHTRYPNSISIYSKDSDDKTILQLAAEMGKIETLQYLLKSSNIKFEVSDVKEALKLLSPTEKNDLTIGRFPGYSRHGNKTVSKANGDQDSQKERVNALMVVATLIAGIAFEATLNPPGGYWQDDTKVDSGTNPETFTYYLNHMFASDMSGDLESYMRTAIHNYGTENSVKDFIQALMKSSLSSSMTSKGLILKDFNLTSFISDYKNSNGSGGFIPYLIRYAGYPILAYTNPTVYTLYMNTNTIAFLLSVMLILLVLSGIVDDYQLLPLVVCED